MEVKRIIITGSSGYLGQHLLHSILTSESPPRENLSYEIWALYKSNSTFERDVRDTFSLNDMDDNPQQEGLSSSGTKKQPLPKHVKLHFTRLDLTNGTEVKSTIRSIKPHLCLHLAAFSSLALAERRPDVTLALNCPMALFTSLAEINAEIVAMSTDHVYDGLKKDRMVKDEEMTTPRMDCADMKHRQNNPYLYVETDETKPLNVYGKTKLAMEQVLQNKLPHTSVTLRSSIIFGPQVPYGNCRTTFLHFIKSRINVETKYWIDEIRTVISVYDLVNIFHWFMEHGVKRQQGDSVAGVYNVGGRDIVSRYDMALAVTRHFGGEECYIKGPQKALEEQVKGVLMSPLDISMDSSKLERTLGITMRGFDQIVNEAFPEVYRK